MFCLWASFNSLGSFWRSSEMWPGVRSCLSRTFTWLCRWRYWDKPGLLKPPFKKKSVCVGEGVVCAHAHACEGQSQPWISFPPGAVKFFFFSWQGLSLEPGGCWLGQLARELGFQITSHTYVFLFVIKISNLSVCACSENTLLISFLPSL